MTDIQLSFEAPPVIEVVVGVALDGLGSEHMPILNAFWAEQARSKFPRLEPQPSYMPPMEEFPGVGAPIDLMFRIGAPPLRLWALTADGQEVLQLQPGWFACNWRRVQPENAYDRWPARREAFRHWFKAFTDFLSAEGVKAPSVTQCEVTYVNHIRAGDVWQRHADFQRVFNVSFDGGAGWHELEQVSAQVAFILEREGQPCGRLHAKILPAFDRDGEAPLYVLEMTARGRPIDDGMAGALAFLDFARNSINEGFVRLTTTSMHDEWRRRT